MTAWDDQGRPTEWVTETEVEFDAAERDSWDALQEWRDAKCPQCGNLRVICHNPDGLHGQGHYAVRDVCYVTAVRQVATRAWEKKFRDTPPDATGFKKTDGTQIWAAIEDQGPDPDLDNALGIAALPDPAEQLTGGDDT